jgi:uncharacterized membrane protein HdeD (DUF308 family)
MKNPVTEYIRLVRTIERAKREARTDELLRAAKESHELQLKMLRPARYEMIDGSGEIGWGMAQLCFALSSYIFVILPSSSWRNGIALLLMLAACIAIPLCYWTIKKFITWPRTGYVAHRLDKKFWTAIVVAAVIGIGSSIVMNRLLQAEMTQLVQSPIHHTSATSHGDLSHYSKIMLAVYVVCNAVLYLMMAADSIGKHPWKWLVLASLVTGSVGISLLVPGNFHERMRLLGLFAGLVWIISGGIVLLSYLRHTHPPATEVE